MAEDQKQPATIVQAELMRQVKDLPHRRAPGFTHFYTNNIGLAVNFYDIAFLFGQLALDEDAKSMLMEDQAMVTMSYEHAKALVKGLQEALENYEKLHGPIRNKPE